MPPTSIQYIAFGLFCLFCLGVLSVVVYLVSGMFASSLPDESPLVVEDPYDYEFLYKE
jgi:hypothetical protein